MANKGATIQLRGVNVVPWSRIAKNMTFSQAFMKKVGRLLVKSIVQAAKKQYRKQGSRPTPIGKPAGLPEGPDFYNSFSYRIRGRTTIEIMSDWPVIEQLIEGRKAYKMPWLTHAMGKPRVPMLQRSGTILVRVSPRRQADAWVHPGFAKHDFIDKGIKNAQRKILVLIGVEVAKKLAKGDPMR